MVGAPDEEGILIAVPDWNGRRVALVVFSRNLVVSFLFPTNLAGILIESGDPGITGVKAGEDDKVTDKDWGAALIPIKILSAKLFGQVPLPADLSVHFESRESTAFEVDKHALSIGDGRGIAAGSKLHVLGFGFSTEFGFPDLFPFEIKCQGGINAFSRSGEKDPVFPNHRGGSAFPGECDFPGDLVGAPFGRVVFAGPASIVRGPPPRWPVLCDEWRQAGKKQDDESKDYREFRRTHVLITTVAGIVFLLSFRREDQCLSKGPTRKDFGTGKNFAKITQEEVAEAEARFNCRPRKRLNYQTLK